MANDLSNSLPTGTTPPSGGNTLPQDGHSWEMPPETLTNQPSAGPNPVGMPPSAPKPPVVTPPVSPPVTPTPPSSPPTTSPLPPASTATPVKNLGMAPAKSSHGVGKVILWLFIIILLLGGLFVGAVYADDAGIWSTGLSSRVGFLPLSSLWGGLSAQPSTAADQVATAIKGTSDYHLVGTITPKSASVTTSATSTLDPLSAKRNFDIVIKGQNLEASLTGTDGLSKTIYRVVSGVLYTTTLGISDNEASATWQKSDASPKITATSVTNQLVALIGRSSFQDLVAVNGNEAYKFEATATGSDLIFPTSLDVLSDWKSSQGKVNFWVSRSTHLITQMQVQMSRSSDKAGFELIAQLDKPSSQTIAAPSASPTSSASAVDAQRKADLKSIETALMQYYTQVRSFPVASAVERLDQPNSVLVTALVPLYLAAMPKDPDGTHYYGYKSDGSTYQLSAVLQNTTDPEGVANGALTLYLLTGPSATATSSPSPSASATP